MTQNRVAKKCFSEGELVQWTLSPYDRAIGTIRGKVQGIPDLGEEWWIVQLESIYEQEPTTIISNYEYSCIVLPDYRLNPL